MKFRIIIILLFASLAAFGQTQVNTNQIKDQAITYAKFQNLTGLSMFGRSANSTGVGASITAGSDYQVLRRSGTSIAFGAVDLSQSAAVTNRISESNLTAKYILDQATPSTAGGTITLDMNSQLQRSHVGSATFATSKIIALSNTTNSLFFNFFFEVTNVAAALTVPSDWLMSTTDFNGTVWTPPATGKYEIGGSFDDVNNLWYVKVSGPFQ